MEIKTSINKNKKKNMIMQHQVTVKKITWYDFTVTYAILCRFLGCF